MKSEILYSILMAGESCDLDKIKGYLKEGIKVIWFGNEKDNERLEKGFSEYYDAGLLNLYLNTNHVSTIVRDGRDVNKNELKILEDGDSRFNLAQYDIEHAAADSNMIIMAGAGTGKTFVMINRIMYLMHTDPDFSFKNIAMITFTNKATDNMRHRLIKTLNIRYRLTGKNEYIDRIEEVSQITLSTIHSFFKKVICEVSPMLGFGTGIRLQSFIQDKKNILRDLLEKEYRDEKKYISEIIGIPIHEMEKLVLEYWEKLDNNGLSEEEVKNLDWGTTSSVNTSRIQSTLRMLFQSVNEEYNKKKYEKNAISMKDIIHELSRVIHHREIQDYLSTKYCYIFCDEFQDSDNVQIETIACLSQMYNSSLFVVGDIKQSIYRFRGATDTAFKKLENNLTEEQKRKLKKDGDEYISLCKNYRTAPEVLEELDKIFQVWGSEKRRWLKYSRLKDKLLPQSENHGKYVQLPVTNKTREDIVMKQVKNIFENNKETKKPNITFLTRRNAELKTIKEWCEKEKMVCLLKEKGNFFSSEAVLDLCALVEAYEYNCEPMFLYNFVKSSYFEGNIQLTKLESCEGHKEKLLVMFEQVIGENWEKECGLFREKPVLSVLRTLIEEKRPTVNFGKKRKQELVSAGFETEKIMKQVTLDMKQYDADLQKILQMLREQFAGDFATLGDICKYLRLNILTNTEEDAADVTIGEDMEGIVTGFTVHGSKGLEFDYVFIPFMSNEFHQTFQSEILVSKDHSKVGWKYRDRKRNASEEDEGVCNDNYVLMIEEENKEVTEEEARLLYVAMTRTIKELYCFPTRSYKDRFSWSLFLPKEKDANEKNI